MHDLNLAIFKAVILCSSTLFLVLRSMIGMLPVKSVALSLNFHFGEETKVAGS